MTIKLLIPTISSWYYPYWGMTPVLLFLGSVPSLTKWMVNKWDDDDASR